MESDHVTKKTILQIYRGNLDPWSMGFTNVPDGGDTEKEFARRSDRFLNKLPERYRKEFNEIWDMAPGLASRELENSFYRGFQTGLRLAVEALYEADGDSVRD